MKKSDFQIKQLRLSREVLCQLENDKLEAVAGQGSRVCPTWQTICTICVQ